MRIRKKVLSGFLMALTVSCLITGCKKGPKETETSSETATERKTEAETQTEKKVNKAQNTTFKSKDGSLSIKLPDETWESKKEGKNEWTFESADQGVITIVHYSGEDMQGLIFPASEEEVLENLEKAGKSKADYAVVEYKKNTLGSYDAYHTTIKCKSTDSKYAYSVAYNLVGEEDIYSVNGQVKKDDATAMESIRDAVESLKLLKTDSTSSSQKKETDSTGQSESTQTESQDTADTSGGQYIYDSNGNTVYVYPDSNGNWVDSNGVAYYFSADGITDSNGVNYYYSKPSGTDGNNNSQPTQTNSFYDNQGNLITVYKDSNGNWVDNNGIVYTFGQYGVTDNYGNYYPYDGSGGGQGNNGGQDNNGGQGGTGNQGNTGVTNGFYDDQGNYITVYQNSNGNWVDSSGMEYTFGNDGVTDSNGNFYPY